jgi:hypothetical protein
MPLCASQEQLTHYTANININSKAYRPLCRQPQNATLTFMGLRLTTLTANTNNKADIACR